MNVLFLNIQPDWKKSFGRWWRLAFPILPAWLCYLAAVVRKQGHGVHAIDQCESGISYQELLRRVEQRNDDVLAVSLLTQAATPALEFLSQVRRRAPNLKIVLGHIHASCFADDILSRDLADVVVHDEGEESFPEVLQALENGSSLQGIQGISYRENGTVHHSERRPFVQDLDALPYPAWDLFDIHRYKPPLFVDTRTPLLPILATRGCPYRCVFCSIQMGRKYRVRSTENVLDEMEHFIDLWGIRQYGFLDANFPLTSDQGQRFCEAMVQRGLQKKIVWATEMRIDVVDRPLLEAMKKSGCTRLQFGIESGTDEGLVGFQKDLSIAVVRENMALIRKYGIETVGLFMLGGPGETREMSKKSIQLACQQGFDLVKFPITVPYPGTALFDRYLKDETFSDEDWEKFTSYTAEQPYKADWLPPDRTKEELLRLQHRAMIKFYLAPRTIYRTLLRNTIRFSDMVFGSVILLVDPLLERIRGNADQTGRRSLVERIRGIEKRLYASFAGVAYAKLMRRITMPMYRKVAEEIGEHLQDGPVLDLGTGHGTLLIEIARRSNSHTHLYGIDQSPNVLSLGQRLIDAEGFSDRIHLSQGWVESLPYEENSMETVVSTGSICYWSDLPRCFQSIRRILKPGGRMIVYEQLPVRSLRDLYDSLIRYRINGLGLPGRTLDEYKQAIGESGWKQLHLSVDGVMVRIEGVKPDTTETT